MTCLEYSRTTSEVGDGSKHEGRQIRCLILRVRKDLQRWRKRGLPASGKTWGCSSVGRAPALQAGGQEFESLHLHSVRNIKLCNWPARDESFCEVAKQLLMTSLCEDYVHWKLHTEISIEKNICVKQIFKSRHPRQHKKLCANESLQTKRKHS